ncbi:MAG: S1 RNA-binding domain-containing protein [Oscillospiraceae bacterium]|nr:S1 RNA-binding domain-containing protein [Oscillospiraceae bacterium]
MEFTVGSIIEGKVKTITKFGAFIALPGGKTGMVHISEIAHAYVNDIHDHLTEGQDVKVMVIAVDPAGKINLSIKRTIEPPPRPARPERSDRPQQSDRPYQSRPQGDRPYSPRPQGDRPYASRSQGDRPRNDRPYSHNDSRSFASKEPPSFDDMLKQFMTDSDSKIASVKQYADHKNKNRRSR